MELNRLKWACRRGMLELDLVLLPFVENYYESIDPADQALFCDLLECEDQDLFAWFLHRHVPENDSHKRIVNIILESNKKP